MSKPNQYGLPRRSRLRKRREFVRLQKSGKRGRGDCCTVIVRRGPKLSYKLGFTVSKKVGNAVVRNLLKRRLRHILRIEPQRCAGYEINVIAHPKAAEVHFSQLERDVWHSFQAAISRLKKTSNAG